MLNPLAPEAWLLAGDQLYRIYVPVCVGCLVILSWDLLEFLPDDIVLVMAQHVKALQVVYVAARLSPFLFTVSAVVFLTHEHDTCQVWVNVTSAMFSLTIISTGLLFLFRLRAVCHDSLGTRRFFTIAWVIHASSTFLQFYSASGVHIGPTRYCAMLSTKPFVSIMFFIHALYEILACLTITYKLSLGRVAVQEERQSMRFWCMRETSLMNRFMQDSQIYFIIAIVMKTAEIIAYFNGNPLVLYVAAAMDTTILGPLASRIYRKLKMGEPGLLSRHQRPIEAYGMSGGLRSSTVRS